MLLCGEYASIYDVRASFYGGNADIYGGIIAVTQSRHAPKQPLNVPVSPDAIFRKNMATKSGERFRFS